MGYRMLLAQLRAAASAYCMAPAVPVLRRACGFGRHQGRAAGRPHSAARAHPPRPRTAPKVQAEIIPVATKVEATDTTSPTARLATPGTFAQKEFNGRTYTVYALDGGRFAYDGSTYKSLTAVAREIAGFRISGNRFFSTNTTFSTK